MCNAQDWRTYPHSPSESLISFPVDEGRHVSEPIEWWYVSGHFTGETSGNDYSFMLTYFYYPELGFDGFRILNITDHSDGSFFQDVKPLNYTRLSTTEMDLEADVFLGGTEYWRNLKDGSNNAIPFEYEIYAAIAGVTFDAEMATTKRPLILGDDGYLEIGNMNYTYYYSQTENDLTGSFTFNGITENITGTSWIDRQFGDFNPLTGEKYEWFSLKLSNSMDINMWNIFTNDDLIPNTPEYRILSAYVNESTQYTESDFELERLQFFCTPDEVNCYAKQWRLTSTTNNLDLTITALYETSEVQLPFRFFEGAVEISGTVNGAAVTGVGFTELLHNYEDPDLSILSPAGGIYDVSLPLEWQLNNPDDGRPIYYDIEYSTDNQNTFTTLAIGLTQATYLWENPPLNENDEVWFKIIAYSIDGVLNSATISDASSTATLSLSNFKDKTIKVYPNPVEQFLNLDIPYASSMLNYNIMDHSGKVIMRGNEQYLNSVQLNVTALANGIYFIRLATDKTVDFVKFIKK